MPSRNRVKSQLRQPAKSSSGAAVKTTVAALDETRTVASVEWSTLLGHRVRVCGKKMGTLKYYGRTLFAEGEWCGVVLDDADGMNDGSVKGIRYFECLPGHGLFAPESKVELLPQECGDSAESSHVADAEESGAVKRLSGISSIENFVICAGVGPGTSTPVQGGPNRVGDALNGTFRIRRLDETFQRELANETFLKQPANETFQKQPANETFVTERSLRNNEMVLARSGEDAKNGDELGENMEEDEVEDLGVVAATKGRQGSLEMDDSLGILTPDQMRDFTMAGAARTPSDEGIQELGFDLEEDPASTAAFVGISSDSDVNACLNLNKEFAEVTPRTCELLAAGAREMITTPQFSQSHRLNSAASMKVGISDITFPFMSELDDTTRSDNKLDVTVVLSEVDIQSAEKGHRGGTDVFEEASAVEFGQRDDELMREKDEIRVGNVEEVKIETVCPKPLSEVPGTVSIKRVVMMVTDVPRLKEKPIAMSVSIEKDKERERPQSSLTVSATSIDTGYQGDAECDPQSEANSPVDTEAKSFTAPSSVSVASAKHKVTGDPSCGGSDSDFCSDMGASWTESEEDANNQNQSKQKSSNARDVRIIDGHVYYNVGLHHRVAASAGVVPKNGPGTGPLPLPPHHPDSTVQSSDADTSSFTANDSANVTVIVRPEVADDPVKESDSMSADVLPAAAVADDVPQIQTPPGAECQTTPAKTPREVAVTPPKGSESTSPKGKGSGLKKGVSVMSKIKAMVMGSGGSSKTANCSLNESTASSKPRTPKKSRWDAVMSRIAAGQAEEKAKAKTGSRKEVKSRINTNLAAAASTNLADKENREQNRSLSGSSGRGDRKQASAASRSTDTNTNEVSDRSASSKLPRASTSCAGSRFPKPPSGLHRTTSQLSIGSGRSQASTLSQMTLASHLSNGKPGCDQSAGTNRGAVSSRVPQITKKPVVASQVAVHRTRAPPPPTTPALSARPRPRPPTRSSCFAVAARDTPASSNHSRAAVAGSSRPLSSSGSAAVPVCTSATGARPKTKASARKTPSRPVAESVSRRNLVKDTSRLKQVMPPTVAQVSSSSVNNKKEVSRLENLCEIRTKEVSQCRMQMRHNALAAQAFSAIISYLAHQLDAFSVPRLQHELRIAQEVTGAIQTDLEHVKSVLESSERETVATLDQVTEQHRTEMQNLRDNHEKKVSENKDFFRKEMEQVVCSHNFIVGNLQQQYDIAKGQLKELESLGKDQCVSCVQNAMEADSLRTVLNMKNQEIKDLQRDTIDLKAKEDDLDYARERVRALENKVEDLTAQLKASIEKERKLTWDIENMKETYEKENKTNKRLSMENETLQYKLQKCKDISQLMAPIDGSDSSGGPNTSTSGMSVYFIEDGSMDGYGSGSPIEHNLSPQRTLANCRPSSAVCLRNSHGYHAQSPNRQRPTSSPSQRLSPKDVHLPSTPPPRRPCSSKSVSDGECAAVKPRNERPNGQQQKRGPGACKPSSPVSSIDSSRGRRRTEGFALPGSESKYFSFSSCEDSERNVADEDEDVEVDVEGSSPEKIYESGRSSGSGSGMEDSGHSAADSILGTDLSYLDVDAARLDVDVADNDEEEDFGSYDGRTAPDPHSVTPPPLSPMTPGIANRTVVIRYRPNRELQNGWQAEAASESGESRSGESSTRSSPRPSGDTDASDEVPRSRVMADHLQDLVGGSCSPRTSAGEAMMVVEELPPCAAAKVLDNIGASEGGFRREDTPEESSQAVAPTDSTNNDYSWSDDELPSETEV